jgi:hypothetical protein
MSTASDSTPRFELNVVQLVAAALAAITSAVVASFFGVAGTVIGAGIGSLVGTLGTAVYSHSLRRTQARLRGASRLVKVGGTERRHVRWQPVVVSTFLVFALAMAGITAAEAGFGRTMWSLVTGRHGSGQSTTIGQLAGTEPATTTPPPAPAATAPSFEPSATPRATREPTPTSARPSPSSEATATPAPAGTQPPEATP